MEAMQKNLEQSKYSYNGRNTEVVKELVVRK